MSDVRHKVFISYYHADQEEVDQFIQTFDKDRKVFISRSVGTSMDQKIFFQRRHRLCNEENQRIIPP